MIRVNILLFAEIVLSVPYGLWNKRFNELTKT